MYVAKQTFIAEHDLVIWRFHDHAHMMRPDPLVAGSARALGWTQYASPGEPRVYILPETTLGELAGAVARTLNDRAIRIAGDPAMKVTRVSLGPGYGIPALNATVDVSIGGEISESAGNTEYVLDAAAAGRPKAMIALGRGVEDHGMRGRGRLWSCPRAVRSSRRESPSRSLYLPPTTCTIVRPFSGWTGRAFAPNGSSFATCAADAVIGSERTSHVTSSLHPGVVNEPP